MTRIQETASDDVQESPCELLEHLVKAEKEIVSIGANVSEELVTVKALSRKLHLNIKDAQREMEKFAKQQKASIHVTYLVKGKPITENPTQPNTSETVIKIVQQEDMDILKTTLTDVSCVIYSVEPSQMPPDPKKSIQASEAKKSLPTSESSKKVDPLVADSKASDIKKDTEKRTKDSELKAHKEEEKRKKIEKIRAEVAGKALEHCEAHEKLGQLFDADDDMESGPMEDVEETIDEPSPEMIIDDVNEVHSASPQNEMLPATTGRYIDIIENDDVEKVVKRVRRRRKVTKKESRVVGKYLRTVDVEGWESYSEDEVIVIRKKPFVKAAPTSDEKPQSKDESQSMNAASSTAAEKSEKKGPKAAKSKAAGQKTLMSFFGKK
ncbi:hypothetical protein HDU67_000925 [Dinochytrium kinnereticum]|nr:hypothetical protein HDU67_000925 [Dinochytrium kinnereticum]